MEIVAAAAACLALGTAVLTCLLGAVYYMIRRGNSDLSLYYFELPHRRHENAGRLETASAVGRPFYSIALLLLMLALVSMAVSLWLKEKPAELARTVEALKELVDLLLPVLVTAIFLFATFKKPYYTLFSTRDVVRKYHLLPCMFISIFSWLLAAAAQIMAGITAEAADPFWQILFHSFALVYLATALAVELLLLVNCCRIFFSSDTAELGLLDTLYIHLRDRHSQLQRMDCGDIRAVETVNICLLGRLKKRSRRLRMKGLHRFARVEFWDTSREAPFRGGRHFRLCLAQNSYMALLFAAVMAVCLWGTTGGIQGMGMWRDFLGRYGTAVLLCSLAGLLVLCRLIATWEPLRRMARIQTYAAWGYRFLDAHNQPRMYYAQGQFPRRQGAMWHCALLNVLALCRIELANGFQNELLDDLQDAIEEEQDRDVTFLLKLAFYLCGGLVWEGLPTEEEKAALSRRCEGVLKDVWRALLFDSWASAIWADVKRDAAWYEAWKLKY